MVLSSMEQHKQALEIYVFKIKDFDKAEKYVIEPLPFLLTPNLIRHL